jgi:hypothetical protein
VELGLERARHARAIVSSRGRVSMRHLVVIAGLLLVAAPASSQVVRVSVSTDGTEANGTSQEASHR